MVAVEQAGGHYLIGTVIAFSVVTPAAYMLHSCFTFSEPARWQAFFRFALSIAATYPAVLLMLAVLCSGLGLSVAIAIPIATVILFAWNFVAAHWAILPRVRHPAPQPQPYREETSQC
jgi:putative flippase GtrA